MSERYLGKARMEITVYPLGTGEPNISKEVSAIFGVLERWGLPYEVTLMGTIVEGTLDTLFPLARELHECMFSERVKRVVTIIKIDEKQ
jgi:uncharacterized protein (TIGR00106 family)